MNYIKLSLIITTLMLSTYNMQSFGMVSPFDTKEQDKQLLKGAEKNNLQHVRSALSCGTSNKAKIEALSIALKSDDKNAIVMLLLDEKTPCDKEAHLHQAIQEEKPLLVQRWLNYGANPMVPHGQEQVTAMQYAKGLNLKDIAKLIQLHCDAIKTNKEQRSKTPVRPQPSPHAEMLKIAQLEGLREPTPSPSPSPSPETIQLFNQQAAASAQLTPKAALRPIKLILLKNYESGPDSDDEKEGKENGNKKERPRSSAASMIKHLKDSLAKAGE